MTEKQLYDALDPLIKKKYEKRFVRSVCGIDDLLQKKRYIYDLKETEGAMLDLIDLLNELNDENTELKKESYGNLDGLETYKSLYLDLSEKYSNLEADYDELKDENQRLTNKLNNTALELVDNVISNGKAVEISEMSYHEFLEYRAKNNKHMELQI